MFWLESWTGQSTIRARCLAVWNLSRDSVYCGDGGVGSRGVELDCPCHWTMANKRHLAHLELAQVESKVGTSAPSSSSSSSSSPQKAQVEDGSSWGSVRHSFRGPRHLHRPHCRMPCSTDAMQGPAERGHVSPRHVPAEDQTGSNSCRHICPDAAYEEDHWQGHVPIECENAVASTAMAILLARITTNGTTRGATRSWPSTSTALSPEEISN